MVPQHSLEYGPDPQCQLSDNVIDGGPHKGFDRKALGRSQYLVDGTKTKIFVENNSPLSVPMSRSRGCDRKRMVKGKMTRPDKNIDGYRQARSAPSKRRDLAFRSVRIGLFLLTFRRSSTTAYFF